jgi:hypothetical protein
MAEAKQLDLFVEPATPAKPTRRVIRGRVKFFPRRNKQAATSDEPVPFDDPIGF